MSNKHGHGFVLLMQLAYLGFLGVLWAIPFWPRQLWWLSDLLVMAPLWVLFIPVVIFILVAALGRNVKCLVIGVVSGLVVVYGIMGFNIPFPYTRSAADRTPFVIKMVSANIGAMKNPDAFLRLIAEEGPEVVVFQELYARVEAPLAAGLKAAGWDVQIKDGMGLASRMKIRSVRVNNRPPFGGLSGCVAVCELETSVGLVYILNVHLETLREGVEAVLERSSNAVEEMQRVTDQQENQSLVAASAAFDLKPLIAAGDFNMPASSPVYRTYWSRYTDAFVEKGFGFGFTKYTRWHGVRIDRIIHDQNWRVIEARVGPDIGSDHLPVIAKLVFTGKERTSAGPTDEIVPAAGTVEAPLPVKSFAQGVASVSFPEWSLERFPMMGFAYTIAPGVSVAMGVRTAWGDWICLGGTGEDQCPSSVMVPDRTVFIDDGMRHEITIDVRSGVQGILPRVRSLTAFQFFGPEKISPDGPVMIDHLKIFASDGKLESSMEAK